MNTDKWTDRLSEYLDGDLSERDRIALEKHLEGCAECAATVEELEAVVTRAGSLDDRPPTRDLWAGIAERIGSTSGSYRAAEVRPIDGAPSRRRWLSGRKLTLSMPQLAAAAAALVVVTGTAVGGFLSVRIGQGTTAAGAGVAPGAVGIQAVANFGGARYDSAVVELEQALEANRGQLDTATVRIIEQNLAIIDQAIEQARGALAVDPGSVYLSNHLAATLKRKIELLRRASSITTVQS